MKWLTLDYIKKHSRIDYDIEDSLLELYGNAAEETVLNYLNRDYHDIITEYGEIPAAIMQASLMLVDHSYTQRSPVSPINMSYVPYTFDALVLPYIHLTERLSEDEKAHVQVVPLGSDVKIEFSAKTTEGDTLRDVAFVVTVYNADAKDSKIVVNKENCIPAGESGYVVLVDTDTLGVGWYMLKVSMEIPDEDFPSGYRKEVVNIDPLVRVIE